MEAILPRIISSWNDSWKLLESRQASGKNLCPQNYFIDEYQKSNLFSQNLIFIFFTV